MYNFNSNLSGDFDSRLEPNSIWNSAGLVGDLNPNLPNVPNNPLQHFQNFAQLNNLTPLQVKAETKISPNFVLNQHFQKEGQESPSGPELTASLLAQYAGEMPSDPVSNPSSKEQTVSGLLSPQTASPLYVPEAPTSSIPSVSPTPTTNKDPGYFSESECSSNSSEKDNLSANFAKSLHIDPYAPLNVPIKSPASSKQSLESIPTAETSPTVNSMLNEDIINALSRYDSQSFDPQDFQLTGDESWKIIKKPGKEADIVPDLSSPESVPYVPSEGSWSGASSPSLGASWNTEHTKPSFVQSTKQQVCVFCRNNGEDASVYTTHTLMSTAGKVICPILFAYKCPICHATGDYAHTLKYCPMMPKGISTSTTSSPPMTSSRSPTLARLPKTATFPKHLSSSAKAAMSMGSSCNMPKSPFQSNRGRTMRTFPSSQQMQQINQFSSGGSDLSSIADLREAAQKILMITNHLQNQPQGSQVNHRNPPQAQVAQFLLKLDKNKPTPSFNSNNNFNRGFLDGAGSNNNMENNIASKLVELLTSASPAQAQGQGYQPFQNSPPQFGSQNVVSDAVLSSKLQELLSATGSPEFSPNMIPETSAWTGSQVPPSNFPQASFQPKTQSTPSPSNLSPFSPNAPVFVPNFGAPLPEDGVGTNDAASAEIFKMLGINKTASAACPKDEISGPEPNKENTLANILANIKEYQNLNNG